MFQNHYEINKHQTQAFLEELFPTHPCAHLSCELRDESKQIRTIYRPAIANDYAEHLSENENGIGIYPSILEPRTKKWRSHFIVLDFDRTSATALEPFYNLLGDAGVHAYLSTGTTGRGAHLFIFFDTAISSPSAHRLARNLAAFAEKVSSERPEYRPSAATERGMGILLPYRKAMADDFGLNPLLDPDAGLAAVNLTDTANLKRTEGKSLERLIRGYGYFRLRKRPTIHQTSPEYPQKNGLEGLEDELERLEPHWQKGVRQNLSLGLAAYAALNLKLGKAETLAALETFLARVGDQEQQKRLEAIHDTYDQLERGRRIAYITFYERAGVDAPLLGAPSSETLKKLNAIAATWEQTDWRGAAGNSDKAVLAALLNLAYSYGREHPHGVTVGIDVRSLAAAAGISDTTLKKSQRRLTATGWLKRDSHIKTGAHRAGAFVLLSTGLENMPHSSSQGQNEWATFYSHPAFRHGFLNKSAIPVLELLAKSTTPQSRRVLQKLIGKDLRLPLKKLIESKLIREVAPRMYRLEPDWRNRLDDHAKTSGAARVHMLQCEKHEVERQQFYSNF